MYSDSELVRMIQSGDSSAFDALVCRYDKMVRGIARQFTALGEDVDDLVQETFVKAYECIDQLRQPDRLAGWLATIARSECLMWRRRRSLRPQLLPLEEDVELPNAGHLGTAAGLAYREADRRSAIRQSLREALSTLTAQQRDAVELHYLHGYDYRETAMLLNVPESAVRGRLDRARTALRKELLKMNTTAGERWMLDRRMLSALCTAAGFAYREPDNKVLNSVLIAVDGRIVATDTHRIFCFQSADLRPISGLLLEADPFRNLADSCTGPGRTYLRRDGVQANLELENGCEVSVPLVEGQYPNWELALPTGDAFSATARASDWLSELSVLSKLRETGVIEHDAPQYPRILLSLIPADGRITLCEGQEPAEPLGISREFRVSFRAEYAPGSPEMIIPASALYVEQAIRAVMANDDTMIELAANSEREPFVIRSKADRGTFVLTMPMSRHSAE